MMALPRSYMRLAGLQSEVNKVTVTRVAGNEVQFRRLMDTYRRDLRYQVEDIARQQQQLRRTIRRYGRKLHQAKKERRQREARQRENSLRHLDHDRRFREAKETLMQQVLHVIHDEQGATSSNQAEANSDTTAGDSQNAGMEGSHISSSRNLSTKDDGELVCQVDTDPQHTSDGESTQQNIQTLSKNVLPPVKAKRKIADKNCGDKLGSNDGDCKRLEAHAGDNDKSSMLINKENGEDGIDDSPENCTTSDATKARNSVMISDSSKIVAQLTARKAAALANGGAVDSSSSAFEAPTDMLNANNARALLLPSLDTKTSTTSTKSTDRNTTPAEDNNKADDSSNRRPKFSFSSVAAAVVLSRKKVQQPGGGVSFGDLVKLQHTHVTNTKQLFRMVDRLAARHAIGDLVDLPAQSPSKDPRHNAKIKARGDKPGSTLSSGIAKQGGVLYAMKYGYAVQKDAEDTAGLPILAAGDAIIDNKQQLGSPTHMIHGEVDSLKTASPRHHSVTDSVTDDVFTDVSLDTFRRRRRHSQTKTPLGMLELSDRVSGVRERSGGVSEWQVEEGSVSSSLRPSLDPGLGLPNPSITRAAGRDSMASQLQQRLAGDAGQEPATKSVWQSAFRRLKVIHTLQDLSGHFSRG